MNSENASPMPPTASFKLTLQGYIPATRNQLKGVHWSIYKKEMMRAAFALQDGLVSALPFSPLDPQMQTVGTSRNLLTALSKLRCWMGTRGINWQSLSRAKRFTRPRRKGRKS